MFKAVVLLSGGLDSTVMLAYALSQKRNCYAITFNYGQKHSIELESAKNVAAYYKVSQQEITIDASLFKNSSLTNVSMQVPTNRTLNEIPHSIPNTYVPARNTLFLAYATAFAETLQADEIYLGSNSHDLHPYPDCRPAFMMAFQNVLNLATKQAVVSTPPLLITPLLKLTKKEIVAKGFELKAPLHLTWSCYQPLMNLPCGKCDACMIRNDAIRSYHTSVNN